MEMGIKVTGMANEAITAGPAAKRRITDILSGAVRGSVAGGIGRAINPGAGGHIMAIGAVVFMGQRINDGIAGMAGPAEGRSCNGSDAVMIVNMIDEVSTVAVRTVADDGHGNYRGVSHMRHGLQATNRSRSPIRTIIMAGYAGIMNLVNNNGAVNRGAVGVADIAGMTRNTICIGGNLVRMVADMIRNYSAAGAAGFMAEDAIAVGGISSFAHMVNRAGNGGVAGTGGVSEVTDGTGSGPGADREGGITIHTVTSRANAESATTKRANVADTAGIRQSIMNILGNIGAAVTLVAIAVPGKFSIGMAAMGAGGDHAGLAHMTGGAIEFKETDIKDAFTGRIEKTSTGKAAGVASIVKII